jgi:hypothetical protein
MLAAASGAVSAMIDVSDGIVPDLSHILGRSGAGAVLDEKAFRRPPRFLAAAKALGVDPMRAFLAGGEDYELLMAVRPHRYEAFRRAARAFPAGVFPIGVVTAKKGIRVRRADGSWMAEADLPRGFAHFERAGTHPPAPASESAGASPPLRSRPAPARCRSARRTLLSRSTGRSEELPSEAAEPIPRGLATGRPVASGSTHGDAAVLRRTKPGASSKGKETLFSPPPPRHEPSVSPRPWNKEGGHSFEGPSAPPTARVSPETPGARKGDTLSRGLSATPKARVSPVKKGR